MRKNSLLVRNITKETVLCVRGFVAETIWERSAGMMFRRKWGKMDGLLLRPCSSIHTFWMWMPIDVCFLDGCSRILRVVSTLAPWRVALGKRGTFATLELPSGTLERTGTVSGDQLIFDAGSASMDRRIDLSRQAC